MASHKKGTAGLRQQEVYFPILNSPMMTLDTIHVYDLEFYPTIGYIPLKFFLLGKFPMADEGLHHLVHAGGGIGVSLSHAQGPV